MEKVVFLQIYELVAVDVSLRGSIYTHRYIYIYIYIYVIYTVPIDKNFPQSEICRPKPNSDWNFGANSFFQFTFVAHHIHESLDYYIPYEQVQKCQSFLADFLVQRNGAWATSKNM